MCLNPIEIPNPNVGAHNAMIYKSTRIDPSRHLDLGDRSRLDLVDCVSKYIRVGCGHCPQCIAQKQSSYIQRVLMESINNHLFMATLTMDNEHLPVVYTSTGYELTYAEPYTLVKCFKRIEQSNLLPFPLRYFACWERGSRFHRPHFHVLFFVPKSYAPEYEDILNVEHLLYWTVRDNWKINVEDEPYKKKFHPRYEPMFQYHEKYIAGKLRKNYDLHFVNPSLTVGGVSDAAFYVLKYMLKQSEYERKLHSKLFLTYEPSEASYLWKLVRSKLFYSTYFGFNPEKVNPFGDMDADPAIISYLQDCINQSKGNFPYPCFYNPNTAQSFPMAKYYTGHHLFSSQFIDLNDLFIFHDFQPSEDNVSIRDMALSEIAAQMDAFLHRVDSVGSENDDYLDELI